MTLLRYTDTGQHSTVTAPGTKVWDFDYNALDQARQYSHPNGLDGVFSYGGGNRITTIEVKDATVVVALLRSASFCQT